MKTTISPAAASSPLLLDRGTPNPGPSTIISISPARPHPRSDASVRATALSQSLAAITTVKIGRASSLNFVQTPARPNQVPSHLANRPHSEK